MKNWKNLSLLADIALNFFSIFLIAFLSIIQVGVKKTESTLELKAKILKVENLRLQTQIKQLKIELGKSESGKSLSTTGNTQIFISVNEKGIIQLFRIKLSPGNTSKDFKNIISFKNWLKKNKNLVHRNVIFYCEKNTAVKYTTKIIGIIKSIVGDNVAVSIAVTQ